MGVQTLVATSAYHVVRVTVRVSVVNLHRDIDVTLPTSSSLAEILPELARLIDIPEVHRPWEAATAAGAPLDMHTPLHKLKLYDGCIITLHPSEPVTPPVVRDAADSLRAAAQGAGDTPGLMVLAGYTGAVSAGVIAAAFVPLPGAVAVGAVVLGVLALVTRSGALFAPLPVALAAAIGAWVAGPKDQWVSEVDPAVGVLVGAATAVTVAALGALAQLTGPATVAFVGTTCAIIVGGALGAWLPAPSAPAALVVLGSVLAVMATPGVATRAAGLRIPHIPTAGEEFNASDGYQADVDRRSARAVAIAGAMTAASAASAVPALGALAWSGGAWPAIFACCTAGAVGMHALRHHYPVPRTALAAMSLAATAAVAIATARTPDVHPVVVSAAMFSAFLAGTAPLWAPRLSELEPTTVVWFERAEMVCIIAVIPLAVHLTGLFALVRGL